MLLVIALAVFGVTLTVTKSKILACKRDFVQKQYKRAKMFDRDPGFVHSWWNAMWTCPMCLGFYVAAIFCAIWGNNFVLDTLAVYGLNWLLHCFEDVMFQMASFFADAQKGKEEIF